MARKSGSYAGITGPKIRETALRLFARHGYAAVSMRKIAQEVGLQVGALYQYTPDKQALLYNLLETHMEDLLLSWGQHSKEGNAKERLEHFARFHIKYHLACPDEVFISYMELRNLTPENLKKLSVLRRVYEDKLDAILLQGVKDRVFTIADTRLTTMAIISMLNGVTNWYSPDGRLGQSEVEDLYSEMVLKSVSTT